jgi:hypothetical protein
LNYIAQECRDAVVNSSNWGVPEAFPEEVVRALSKSEVTRHILFQAISSNECPLTNPYFSILLKKVHNASLAEKGEWLENLAMYLALLLPGCLPLCNVEDEDKASEHDIVVRNLYPNSTLTSEILGRHFLIECKNRNAAIGSPDVGYFLYRMKLTHTRFGIIISSQGITGSIGKTEKAATALIRRAFHEDDSVCVILNDDDLRALECMEKSFLGIILERIEKLRFGAPRSESKTSKRPKRK